MLCQEKSGNPGLLLEGERPGLAQPSLVRGKTARVHMLEGDAGSQGMIFFWARPMLST
jgi:hypothetical protein